jgi:hypothetical protein
LRDGNTAVATSTHTLAAGDWVRVEWYVDRGGTSTQTLELFYSGNIEGTIPNEVLTGACTAATTPLHQVSSGLITASAGAQFAVDEAVLAELLDFGIVQRLVDALGKGGAGLHARVTAG